MNSYDQLITPNVHRDLQVAIREIKERGDIQIQLNDQLSNN